jgi:hypothetical protein
MRVSRRHLGSAVVAVKTRSSLLLILDDWLLGVVTGIHDRPK